MEEIKNIEVSVIVVTYNQEETIGRTLDSILRQECDFEYEIVIGEDASTDGTREICERYKAEYGDRIVLLANRENKGVVENYFDCIENCRGRFLADCAGDDFWVDEKKLQKEYDILSADDDVMLVHTAWNYYDEERGETKEGENANRMEWPEGKVEGRRYMGKLLANEMNVHLCTALYRKSVVMEAMREGNRGMRRKEFMCEDLPIVMAMASEGSLYYLNDVTLNYSIGRPSVSHEVNVKKQVAFLEATILLKCSLSKVYGIGREELKNDLQNRVHGAIMMMTRERDWEGVERVVLFARTNGVGLSWKSKIVDLMRRVAIGRWVMLGMFR